MNTANGTTQHTITISDAMWQWAVRRCGKMGPATYLRNILTAAMAGDGMPPWQEAPSPYHSEEMRRAESRGDFSLEPDESNDADRCLELKAYLRDGYRCEGMRDQDEAMDYVISAIIQNLSWEDLSDFEPKRNFHLALDEKYAKWKAAEVRKTFR